MNLAITRLGPEDTGRAADNCRLFWDMDHADRNLEAYLNDPKCILLVAEADGRPAGQIIGYILRRWDSKQPILFLYSIDVAESLRRRGVARALIKEFLRIGRESGCGKSFVFTNESNTPAMKLYRIAGGNRIYQDDVMFQWDLFEAG